MAAAGVVAWIFLFETGGGNWIGGLAVAAGLMIFGGAAAVFYLLGWAGALGLRLRGDARYVRGQAWLSLSLVIAAAGVMVISGIKAGLKDRRTREDREAAQRAQSEEDAILASPAALQAWVAGHGLETPLPASSRSPLEAAVATADPASAETFIQQGARVSDRSLASAAQRQDPRLVALLLSKTVFDGAALTGQDALQQAFSQGSPEILRMLVAAGVPTNRLLVQQVSRSEFLRYFAGETDWQSLSKAWHDPSAPRLFQATAASEEEVLTLLNQVLGNDELYSDPAVGFKAMRLPVWMKETPSSGWNNSPLIRPINWAILESLYPRALPSFGRAKATSMLRFLADKALDKRGEGGRTALRTAFYDRNVAVIELLVQEGFSLQLIEGEFHLSSFLDVPDDRYLKTWLEGHGLRPQP